MRELISIAALIATLFGGTVIAGKIYCSVREAALTKAAQGLPRLSTFSHALTSHQRAARGSQAPSRGSHPTDK